MVRKNVWDGFGLFCFSASQNYRLILWFDRICVNGLSVLWSGAHASKASQRKGNSEYFPGIEIKERLRSGQKEVSGSLRQRPRSAARYSRHSDTLELRLMGLWNNANPYSQSSTKKLPSLGAGHHLVGYAKRKADRLNYTCPSVSGERLPAGNQSSTRN